MQAQFSQTTIRRHELPLQLSTDSQWKESEIKDQIYDNPNRRAQLWQCTGQSKTAILKANDHKNNDRENDVQGMQRDTFL